MPSLIDDGDRSARVAELRRRFGTAPSDVPLPNGAFPWDIPANGVLPSFHIPDGSIEDEKVVNLGASKLIAGSIDLSGGISIVSASSGERFEITAPGGFRALDSGGNPQSIMDVAGFQVKYAPSSSPSSAQCYSFTDANDAQYARMFVTHPPGDWPVLYIAGRELVSGKATQVWLTTDGPVGAWSLEEDVFIVSDQKCVKLRAYNDRVQLSDDRMTSAAHYSVPVIDYGVVACSLGVKYETSKVAYWTGSNHATAPTVCFAQGVVSSGHGASQICVGIATKYSNSCVVDWETVDGANLTEATNIVAVGIWL